MEDGAVYVYKLVAEPDGGYSHKYEGRYKSIAATSDALKITRAQIASHLKGRQKRVHEYVLSREHKFPGYSPYKQALRKIDCYDSNGELIESFDNVASAAEKMGVPTSRIYEQCSRAHFISDDKYIFRYGAKNKKPPKVKRVPRPVYQFKETDPHKVVRVFPTISAAAEAVKVTKQAISQCCNGKGLTAGGFYWSFNPKVERIKGQ
jgi:hypothetical protein